MFTKLFALHFALLIAICILKSSCAPDDILIACTADDNCSFSNHQLIQFHKPQFKQLMYNLVSSGVARVFWDAIRLNPQLSQLNITDSCKSSLNRVIDGLTDGDEWAFQSES